MGENPTGAVAGLSYTIGEHHTTCRPIRNPRTGTGQRLTIPFGTGLQVHTRAATYLETRLLGLDRDDGVIHTQTVREIIEVFRPTAVELRAEVDAVLDPFTSPHMRPKFVPAGTIVVLHVPPQRGPDPAALPWRQIYHDIRTEVQHGIRLPSHHLPTIAELAELYQLPQTPVRRALRELHADGWLTRQKGPRLRIADPPPTGQPVHPARR